MFYQQKLMLINKYEVLKIQHLNNKVYHLFKKKLREYQLYTINDECKLDAYNCFRFQSNGFIDFTMICFLLIFEFLCLSSLFGKV